MIASQNDNKLSRSLKNRHILMIALGGCIGTGLFFGTAEAIALSGPSIILGYLLGGFMIYMIICMMGEMATHEPVSGAFSHFAYKYWGKYPGFLAGWNYWFLYILVSMAELSVVGKYINYWFPLFEPWLTALIIIIVITSINLASVKFFGEAEFWLAVVKVLAVVGMIAFGIVLIVLGLMNKESTIRVSNLWEYGFFANGWWGVWVSLVIVMFSFGGTELIGITAGEADNPKESIPKAVRQVMFRILIFYLGAIIIMLILSPWTQLNPKISPFVLVFDNLGIKHVGGILNFVILTAAISVYNSSIYSNGRMLYGLAEQGNAPKIFRKLSRNHIPYVAILFSSGCTLVVVAINFLIPDGAFMMVMSLAIAAAVITWAMIVIVHLFFRKAIKDKEEDILVFKTPFYPFINIICLLFLIVVIAAMTQLDNFKPSVYIAPLWIALTFIGYLIKERWGNKPQG